MTGPTLEIECPHCQATFHQNAREISVKGSRSCPACGGTIEFSGSLLFRIIRKMDHFPRPGSWRREERSHL